MMLVFAHPTTRLGAVADRCVQLAVPVLPHRLPDPLKTLTFPYVNPKGITLCKQRNVAAH